ncbi:MAG: bis(5'-nucleosyl)-tetraphosphatase (symmetrical) YqeK [Oscillospiraceae bacterium]|nr:bis(5'-nucleosyl)-tetraphosphatase (symmetrical) YqeK [Oscillospiraceae bacterium]
MDTERNSEFLEILKQRLTPARLYHSICVAEQARNLAKIFGANTEKAYTAGLIHDIMRYEPPENMLKLIDEDGKYKLTELERKITVTLHAVAGEVYLRKVLGVTDEEILSAVRYHTTGRENMSLLEKIIYVADLTSEDRNYPDVGEVCEMAEQSLEKATLRGLSFTIESNAKENKPIHIDTVKAYNYLAERT